MVSVFLTISPLFMLGPVSITYLVLSLNTKKQFLFVYDENMVPVLVQAGNLMLRSFQLKLFYKNCQVENMLTLLVRV